MTTPKTPSPILRARWRPYLDAFSKRFLRDAAPELATVTVRGGPVGERRAVSGARLLGITYDPHDHALDVALEGPDGRFVDHLVLRPVAIWTCEAEDGFVEQLTVLRGDGLRETITIERAPAAATA